MTSAGHTRLNEKLYTDPTTSTEAERKWKMCKCGVCKLVARQSPLCDFYVRGKEKFLRCGICVLKR